MKQVTIDADDEATTMELGRALAEILPGGTTVALDGPLGAGKTRLVQALAMAAGVEPDTAVSPTFVLVQEYHGARDIIHVDAYRLRDEDEFQDLGLDEHFDSEALVLVEWAERVAGALPRNRLRVEIRETGQASRRFVITALAAFYEEAIDRLAAWDRARRA
jgi:tRNA threonylcarbamoyladenosine biosynthesis protein TsaE